MKSKNTSTKGNEKDQKRVIVDQYKMWRIFLIGFILYGWLVWRLGQIALQDKSINFGLTIVILGVTFAVVLIFLVYKYAALPNDMGVFEKIKYQMHHYLIYFQRNWEAVSQ